MLACILGGVLAAETGGHGDLVREVAELASNIQIMRESMAASLASLHGDMIPQRGIHELSMSRPHGHDCAAAGKDSPFITAAQPQGAQCGPQQHGGHPGQPGGGLGRGDRRRGGGGVQQGADTGR